MASTSHQRRLPQSRRLKTGRDFAQVRAGGRRMISGCLILNWMTLAPGSASRLGIVASKKIGDAVRRNRSKRLLREVFRLHQHELARPVDLVLVARPSLVGKCLADVERDYLEALRQARLTGTSP